jgi:septal ring factor EnvC (AmiA/AmiB activator)
MSAVDTTTATINLEDKHGAVTSESETSTSAEERRSCKVRMGGARQVISSSRKRVIDESLLSPEDADKLESRRAYNRECATRARKRTKNLVAQLQEDVKNLQQDKNELRRANEVMKAQLAALEKQNQALLFKHAMNSPQTATMSAFGMTGNGGMLPSPTTLDTAFSNMLMNHQATARNRIAYPAAGM